ncbi:hypothetical protein R1sor_023558 [Riccia sorocarpa]|uniref:Uncharacterized protein n=1 Tax=Riccia sorocarpa TaxID=122646 RepID=A0ABD3GQZ6_9MARC
MRRRALKQPPLVRLTYAGITSLSEVCRIRKKLFSLQLQRARSRSNLDIRTVLAKFTIEVPALRGKLEDTQNKLLEQHRWRQSSDDRIRELIEEIKSLQDRLLAAQKQLDEVASDFRFVMRHNKCLERELRKLKRHLKTKRARKDRVEETLSDSSDSLSDSDHRADETLAVTLPNVRTPMEPRRSGETNIILADPISLRRDDGSHAPRLI